MSAFLAFFLLRDAPVLSERLAVAADRLAGVRGQHLIKVAGDTVRGVIYGILGTAIAQALVAGLESEFGIMLDTDDIIGMSSVAVARTILVKYGVAFDS